MIQQLGIHNMYSKCSLLYMYAGSEWAGGRPTRGDSDNGSKVRGQPGGMSPDLKRRDPSRWGRWGQLQHDVMRPRSLHPVPPVRLRQRPASSGPQESQES